MMLIFQYLRFNHTEQCYPKIILYFLKVLEILHSLKQYFNRLKQQRKKLIYKTNISRRYPFAFFLAHYWLPHILYLSESKISFPTHNQYQKTSSKNIISLDENFIKLKNRLQQKVILSQFQSINLQTSLKICMIYREKR